MVITGYRIKTTDLAEIEKEMDSVRERIMNTAAKAYHATIGKEAAFLWDSVCTEDSAKVDDYMKYLRDNKMSVMNDAVKIVDDKVRSAGMTGVPTDYNFSIFVHLLPYERATYLKVTTFNPKLLKAFRSGKFEEFSLSEEDEKDEKNSRRIIWTELHRMYKDANPPVVDLTPVISEIHYEEIRFPSVAVRARDKARDSVVNEYLVKVSGGGQIPPHLLLPFIREAEALADTEEGKHKYNERLAYMMEKLFDLNQENGFLYENIFYRDGGQQEEAAESPQPDTDKNETGGDC